MFLANLITLYEVSEWTVLIGYFIPWGPMIFGVAFHSPGHPFDPCKGER